MSVPVRDEEPENEDRAPKGSTARHSICVQAALISWRNTTDRTQRMSVPHDRSPAQVGWHARKLGLNPDSLSPQEFKRAEAARRAYMVALSRRAHRARQRKKARRLREQADQLDRQASAGDADDAADVR